MMKHIMNQLMSSTGALLCVLAFWIAAALKVSDAAALLVIMAVPAVVGSYLGIRTGFHGLTLPMRNSADLVMLPATGTEAMFGLPDSGDMPTIIAPDLSNLPAGETAINPETGEEFTKGG